ncbi:GAF domain-containing protein [Nocardia sp. SYP-A9097]|uniref:GAF and ANTAR domain-containing protein n=1 Tax=Nocardia sp. SYP-A9097 TaxID=2663237 RepID=UPI00129B56C7|nr:GAF and ANTAR domain-containing protein [Nocardia sp. SYP-A9097]MRH90695.1 GAF domain-containing protein [Nocardia sp. SYP-A9097]
MFEAPLSNGERESGLLDAFVQMADTLVDDYDIVDVLHELASHCERLLNVGAAGILMSDQRGGLQMLASSTEQAAILELYQIQTNEGPCWDCVHSGETVFVPDLTVAADRWPHFVPRALNEGFAAVHAIPMRLRQETIGALNLFGRIPGPMPARDVRAARALADTATIGILQERAIHRSEVLTEQLQGALINRVIIEQAKGVLAQAGNVDMDHAFQALRSYGRRRSTRLSEVARQLTTGEIHPDTVLSDQHHSNS